MWQLLKNLSKSPWTIWVCGCSFLFFQFFMQLSSGVVLGAVMQEFHFSALSLGLLSSAFYYVYTSMQIPVGYLFDRYNARWLMAANMLICALGCLIFAYGTEFLSLFIARLIMGGGSSFAFVGVSLIIRQHFPLKRFAFMIGLSETLSFLITVAAMNGMGLWINTWGWRFFLILAGLIGIFISIGCAVIIPAPVDRQPRKDKPLVMAIFSNPLAWVNGLFVGLEFSIITVFAAMWGIPFLQLKMHCSLSAASMLAAMVFLGAGLSCPLFGQLSQIFVRRNPLIYASCAATALLMLIILYWPISSELSMGILLFLSGLSCGAYMLAFSIANELAPPDALSTCTGFTNTLAMITAPLLQPLVGYLLDFRALDGQNQLADYQFALLIVPASIAMAGFLASLLPEKSVDRVKK